MNIYSTLILVAISCLFSCNKKLEGLYCSQIYHTNACLLFSKNKKFHYSQYGDTGHEGYGTYQITDKELVLYFKEKIPCSKCLQINKINLLKDSVSLKFINNGSHKYYTVDIYIPSTKSGANEQVEVKEFKIKLPFNDKGTVRIRDMGLPSIDFELTEPGEYEINFEFENRLQFQISDTERTYNILEKSKQNLFIEWRENEIWKWNLIKDFESSGYKYWKPHFRKKIDE